MEPPPIPKVNSPNLSAKERERSRSSRPGSVSSVWDTGRIRGDQELRVVSQYAPYRKEVRVEIKQQVTSGEKVVVEAHLYYFFYNFSTSRPIRPPEDIMRKARLID